MVPDAELLPILRCITRGPHSSIRGPPRRGIDPPRPTQLRARSPWRRAMSGIDPLAPDDPPLENSGEYAQAILKTTFRLARRSVEVGIKVWMVEREQDRTHLS